MGVGVRKDYMIATREQIEETVWYLTVIAERAMEAIIVIDFSGAVRFVNTAWARMHGYENSRELIGKHINVFHTEEQMETDVIPFIEEVKQRGQLAGPVEHVRRNGVPFSTEMLMVILRDRMGNAQGLIGFAKDVTNNEHTNDELEQYRDHLAELIKQQTGELKVANEQLQREIVERKQVEKYIKKQVDKLRDVNTQLQDKINELNAHSRIHEADVFEITAPHEAAVLLSHDEEVLVNIFRENVALQQPESANDNVDKSISEDE